MNELQTVNNKQFYSLSGIGLNDNYQSDINIFNRYAAGRPITADLINEFFKFRAAAGLSISTLQRNKAALKQAVKKALGQGARLGEIAQLDTFFKEMKAGTGKIDCSVTENKVLTKEELIKLLEVSGLKTALIIESLYHTACRVSELCNIEIDKCKNENGSMRIKIWRDKTKQFADVFMPAELFEKIRTAYQGNKYLFEVDEIKKINGKRKKTGKRIPISRFTVHVLIKKAGAKINRSDIHAHTLRHSFATLSMPILGLSKVSKYLSHSTPNTTAKYYVHGKATAAEIMDCNMTQLTI